ncbi:twin transmembrane helix small protein [Candidatus Berkiella aquae]|uniref:Twin transmembrane helix small protein n=1 Tax=Candidatus Berkiella aquae TaxID=295108 RepID=A0AAE3HTA7_9GAMM|nr:twin transmembrane helix small protein [Candidatus Berkiella aquae]MCS5710082.1 twin transmembrane helix small protein [Candidatus Berkiella aquae]
MTDHWIIKLFIYALMLGIVFSLGSGMYYLLFAKEQSQKTVKALTVRISLSIGLFILLFIAFAMGWIRPHNLLP